MNPKITRKSLQVNRKKTKEEAIDVKTHSSIKSTTHSVLNLEGKLKKIKQVKKKIERQVED